jgi:6-bladed beta-propeller protein
MARVRRNGTLVGVVALVVACSDPPSIPVAGAGGFEVRDSAGVEVVTNSAPRFSSSPPFRLPRRATVRIGSLDGPDAFGRPTGATRLSDGRILVLDSQSQRIEVFDAEGDHIGAWGRDGQGPGEFSGASRLHRLPGDTVVVLDRSAFRTTVVAPDGSLVRTFPARFDFQRSPGQMIAQSCCIDLLPLGSALSLWRYPQVWAVEGSGSRPVYATVVRSTPAGTDTLGVFRSGAAGDWPNGVNPVVREALGPEMFFGASRGRLMVGLSAYLGFEEIDPASGRVIRRVSGVQPRIPVTEEMIAASIGSSPEMTPALRERLLNRPHADSMYAYSGLLVAPSGEVWLRSPAPEGPLVRSAYQVFAANGEWLGEVEFPTFLWLLEVGPDYVLGSTRGKYDEGYVELWEFKRPG